LNRRRLPQALALLVGGALAGVLLLAGVAAVVAAATGVASTPPGAWVTRVAPLPGIEVRVNVPALLRLATTPAAQRLLDGRSLSTRFGRLRFGRGDGVVRGDHAVFAVGDRWICIIERQGLFHDWIEINERRAVFRFGVPYAQAFGRASQLGGGAHDQYGRGAGGRGSGYEYPARGFSIRIVAALAFAGHHLAVVLIPGCRSAP